MEGDVTDLRINKTLWQEEELNIVASSNIECIISDLQEQLWIVREEDSGTHKVVENKLQELDQNNA